MNIFVDLDNTLCETQDSNYTESKPIKERINKVNKLKDDGNKITIWTARGQTSGIDYKELTQKQLTDWGIRYDKLLMGKPSYDLYIDDKSINVDKHWKIPTKNLKSKKIESKIVKKGWGKEIWFVNNDEYCGKILCFDKGKKFSMHYHVEKKETWYIAKGKFLFSWICQEKGIVYNEYLNVGDVITNERGEAHQMEALEESEIFEVSTFHKDSDSYRIEKGD
jgi:quercetin dioxygenase-like cupin family protein|tara:strand:+ start:2028 stop:2693 length:666 start_codon:yes stop_codon:yes gene_type:complete